MNNFIQASEGWFNVICTLSLMMLIGICILLKEKFPHLVTWFQEWLGRRNRSGEQSDGVVLKKTTMQIAQNWVEMIELMRKIQMDQNKVVMRLQSMLEGEFIKNDQRFTKMRQAIEIVQNDFLSMKDSLEVLNRTAPGGVNTKQENLTNSFAQTEYEVKRRSRDGHVKNISTAEHETKLISMVKQCLADVMKDTKLHLKIDREEENKELQVFFTKLAEDREDIKQTIVQAFLMASEETKKNFDQFNHVGQNAMHYMAELSDNTNKILKLKLEDIDKKLAGILNSVCRHIFEVDGIKETLEHIDEQFNEIFQRVEVGCQKNSEQCKEIAQSLQRTSNNWVGTASEIEKVAKTFAGGTDKLKEMFAEMQNLINLLKQDGSYPREKVMNEIIQFDSGDVSAAQGHSTLSPEERNKIFIYQIIQCCWEKITTMNNRLESGCESICKLTGGLEKRLRSLNGIAERLDEILQNVNLESLADHLACNKCSETYNKIAENTLQSNVGHTSGDLTQIFPEARKNVRNETPNEMQNAVMIDSEMKMIEIILRRVCEKTNLEVATQPKQQSASILTHNSQS